MKNIVRFNALLLILLVSACGSSGSDKADADGDGIVDRQDAFPNDKRESKDTDGDGIGDNADIFPNDKSENKDTDGDGIGDNADIFPNDKSENKDTDLDDVGDNIDNCPLIANTDQLNKDANLTNGDTLGDACDTDDDGDGVLDADDAFPLNKDETKDTDRDGVGDNSDNCLTVANASQLNTDASFTNGDALGNACDPNDDGDSELDGPDPFPLDPTEWADIDEDNIGDNKDLAVGNNNTSAAQLTRFKSAGRATLFIGGQTSSAGSAEASVKVVNAGDVNGDNIGDLLIGVGEGYGRDGKAYLFFGSNTPWPEEIDLASIPESVKYIEFLGEPSSPGFNNLLGADVTAALGDINGDGLDDFLMGGSQFEISGVLDGSGEAYLIFGRTTWLPDAGDDHIITMAELKSQYAITYQGQKAFGLLGGRVAATGDVNGDNINDFLIGEYGYDQSLDSAEGRVHLMFGGTHLQPPVTETSGILNVDTLPTSTRTLINIYREDGDPNTFNLGVTLLGEEILGLGNFDNDSENLSDIAITSSEVNKVYVLFGRTTWPAVIDVRDMDNGKGFIFEAPAAMPEIGIGKHIAAGDLNGDNIPELIIAQTNSTDAAIPNKQGDVVILKGGVGNWPASLSMDNLIGGTLDFFAAIWSTSEKLALGSGLAVLPDNNNDGFGELLISAPKPESPGEGLIFKVAGNANLAAKELNSTTTDAGVEIIRNLSLDIAGSNIRTLGDYNGDGINEFVIDIQDADATPEGDDTVRTDNGLFYVIQGYSSLYPETAPTE